MASSSSSANTAPVVDMNTNNNDDDDVYRIVTGVVEDQGQNGGELKQYNSVVYH